MNAPSSPRPTWSVALWWEWYMCEPAVRAMNSYVNESPGSIGSWVTCGTPSMLFGSFWPWKWMPGRLVEVVREDRPDLVALDDIDPRARPRPVEAERLDRLLLGVDLVADLVDRELEDLDVAVERRLLGLVAHAFDAGALAVEEALHDREGGGVVVARDGRRAGRSRGVAPSPGWPRAVPTRPDDGARRSRSRASRRHSGRHGRSVGPARGGGRRAGSDALPRRGRRRRWRRSGGSRAA